MPERKQLPGPSVPIDGYKLIRRFARNEDMSISDAIRQLLKESPRLVEFAKQNGMSVDMLDVGAWGGSRDKDEETGEEPPIAQGPKDASPRPRLPVSILQKAAATQTRPEPHLEPVVDAP